VHKKKGIGMEVEYKKDLKHNYMVIAENNPDQMEAYSIKMLEAQTMEGILSVEQRSMDNKILLYYDITAKQAMSAILDKTVLSYDKVRNLCTGIIETIERAYEYLLPEDDFILSPEYIYMEVGSNKPVLCFLPGYGLRIKEQMSSFIEYLMNKVDYNDKEAVLLVYQLYADSREEGYTFDHLWKALQEKPLLKTDKGRKGVGDEKETVREKEITTEKEIITRRNKETFNISDKKNNFLNNINPEKIILKNNPVKGTSSCVKSDDRTGSSSEKVYNNDFRKSHAAGTRIPSFEGQVSH
jgi:hypothetical protein